MLIVAILYFLIGCSEEPNEPTDPFIGTWIYGSNGINTEFQIIPEGSGYKLNNIKVDGSEWLYHVVTRPILGETIESIAIIKDSTDIDNIKSIVFFNCNVVNNEIHIDSIAYTESHNNQSFFLNQSLKRK